MAVAKNGSVNAHLWEGATDGKYKKITMNRGGQIDPATWEVRDDLQQNIYGRVETPYKETPDGKHVFTPNTHSYLPVGPAQI